MKKLLFDLETNGLLDTVSEIWIGGVKDLETGEIKTFSDFDKSSEPLSELTKYLGTADVLIGHNIISYDLNVLKLLLNWDYKKDVKIIDTMLVSQLNNFKREGKHSLKAWGVKLGDDKLDFSDFSQYTDEMKTYMIQDINLNHKVYKALQAECKSLVSNRPTYKDALNLEHDIAKIVAQQVINKWKFDLPLARKHFEYLSGEMKKIEDEVHPQLKERVITIDKEDKTVKYLRDGRFSVVTARLLSEYYGKEISQSDTHVCKPDFKFRRTKKVPAELGNMDMVRELLLENGWKPTFWTPGGEPKITEDSLASIESDMGKKILHYYSLRSRHSVLAGWIELAESNNGRVYVEAFNLGTPTRRQRHAKIVNVPGVKSFFGKEMRELFTADDNKIMIGCDSSGNQIRALAHYLNNEEVNHHILKGDIHQHNADTIGISRPLAKGVLYASIFGAGMKKLAKMISGDENNIEVGRNAKYKLYEALPGLKELTGKLNTFWYSAEHKNGMGFIPALDGSKVYAESSFKCLNYLLQSFEAVTVKTAVVQAFKMFDKEKLDVQILALVHDEVQVQTDRQSVDRVKEILEYCFGDYITKKLKLNIQMNGDAKAGFNWFETH